MCCLQPFFSGHVITGLRLRKLGSHLNLEARITPIDFSSGKLDTSISTWIGNDKTQASYQNRRTRVSLIAPDIPTRYLSKNIIDSVNNQVRNVFTRVCLHFTKSAELLRPQQNNNKITQPLFVYSLLCLTRLQFLKTQLKPPSHILMPRKLRLILEFGWLELDFITKEMLAMEDLWVFWWKLWISPIIYFPVKMPNLWCKATFLPLADPYLFQSLHKFINKGINSMELPNLWW